MTSSLQLDPPAGQVHRDASTGELSKAAASFGPRRGKRLSLPLGWAANANAQGLRPRQGKRRLWQDFQPPAIPAPASCCHAPYSSFAFSITRTTRHAFVFESLRAAWI